MRSSPRLPLFLLAATALLAIPAVAQQPGSRGGNYGFDPPAGTALTPHGQGGAGAIPPVEGQYEAARRAGTAGNSTALLQRADQALAGNDAGTANEYLERAATALLNQPEIEAGPEGVRSVGPGRLINEARAALAKSDLPAARQSVQAALTAIRRADGGTAAGVQGGGSR